jgi:hypothetical protein
LFIFKQPRFRIRENTPRFRLDTQESQWSTRYNQNSFQPIDEEKSKAFHSQDVDDNQEIVTVNPNAENVIKKIIFIICYDLINYCF